ncbi:hypothetical protein VPH35_043302 [Triticum aestivum]
MIVLAFVLAKMIRQVRCLRSSSAPTSSAAKGGDGQNWLGGDGATVACGADVSLQCPSEQRHRRKTLRLTGMEPATYCAQEDSLHLLSREALRRGRRPRHMAAMAQDRLCGCDVRPGGQG